MRLMQTHISVPTSVHPRDFHASVFSYKHLPYVGRTSTNGQS